MYTAEGRGLGTENSEVAWLNEEGQHRFVAKIDHAHNLDYLHFVKAGNIYVVSVTMNKFSTLI